MIQLFIALYLYLSTHCESQVTTYLFNGEYTIDPISQQSYKDIAREFQNELWDELKNKNMKQHVQFFCSELSHVFEHHNNKFRSLSFKDIAFLEYMYSYYHPRNDLNREINNTDISTSLEIISLAEEFRNKAKKSLEIIKTYHTESTFRSLSQYLLEIWEQILI